MFGMDGVERMTNLFAAAWPLEQRMTLAANAGLERYAVSSARRQFPGKTVALERDERDPAGQASAAGEHDDRIEHSVSEAVEIAPGV